MPRQLRIEYEGAIYHVMSRGDRRENIVLDDGDRALFVATLGAAAKKCGWQVHAWCLMSNHFHLVVETPQGNLVVGMKWFLTTYTVRFNLRHQLRGHLFSGRYKSLIVDNRSPQYLRAVCDYVHLNPARASLLESEEPLDSWRWSSYADYLRPAGKRPLWLRTDRVFSEHQVRKDTVAGRKLFAEVMEKKRLSPELDDESELAPIRRGWRIGSEEFVAWLQEKMVGEKEVGESHPVERREADKQKARRLIAEGLQKEGWLSARLLEERKSHPWKVAMAKQLRENTPMTLRWIAENLVMGQWTHVSNLLAQPQKNHAN